MSGISSMVSIGSCYFVESSIDGSREGLHGGLSRGHECLHLRQFFFFHPVFDERIQLRSMLDPLRYIIQLLLLI